MLDDEEGPDLTRAGLFNEIAGQAKEALGDLVGHDELAQHGREQQAEAESGDPRLTHEPRGEDSR